MRRQSQFCQFGKIRAENQDKFTLLENHPKCLIKIDLSGNTVFKKSLNKYFLGFFLSTQNVARFARNIEWDFLFDFQTPFTMWKFSFVFDNFLPENVKMSPMSPMRDPYLAKLRHFWAKLSSFSLAFCVAPQGVNSGPSITLAV